MNNYTNLKEAILYYGFNKENLDLTWDEIANILNQEFDENLNWNSTRQRFANYKKDYEKSCSDLPNEEAELLNSIVELKKEKYKLNDINSQINADIRRMSREDTLKEIALAAVDKLDEKFPLTPTSHVRLFKKEVANKKAILQISDWHYGVEIDNFWNHYNLELAKKRIESLRDAVIDHIEWNNIRELYVVNLGDLIAGRIHLALRLNSRIDTVTQAMQIAELLSEFLADLSNHVEKLHYYSTTDNHSRIEPIKDNSIDLESFVRIIDWHLTFRLKDFNNIEIHDNMYGDDIVVFKVYDYEVVGVHGDKDKPNKVIHNMTGMTQKHYDLVLTSHRHHFSGDEENETLLISNGSLMGTDDYAVNLRLSSKPSQNLIIVTPDNVMEYLYRIVLDN